MPQLSSALRSALVALAFLWPASALAGGLTTVMTRTDPSRISPTVERIVVDPKTGLAIGGYDPVAYFLGDGPRLGEPQFEAVWAGAVWRFVNEGNLGAFLEAPLVYMPRFGGHCADAASEGRIAVADPRLWTIWSGRLYFARSPEALAAFRASTELLAARAEAAWPALERTLAP